MSDKEFTGKVSQMKQASRFLASEDFIGLGDINVIISGVFEHADEVMQDGKKKSWNPLTVKSKYAGETLRATAGKAELDDGHSMRRRERVRAVVENKIRGNVWKYTVGTNSTTQDKYAFEHPAIFPEALAKDHVASWSNPGDVVLDPFAGSGTTLKAAKELNRRFIGIEINPEYVAICHRRLAQEVLNLFPDNARGDTRRDEAGLQK